MFHAFVAMYAVGRFFIEFLRGDADHGFLGPLSVPQWYCAIVFLAVTLLYIRGFQLSQASAARARVSARSATSAPPTVSVQATATKDHNRAAQGR